MLDLPAEIMDTLPSLAPSMLDLRAVLASRCVPRSVFVLAQSNLSLLPSILKAVIPAASIDQQAAHLYRVQRALPSSVIVDCAELASQKALFGRILNGLSGWGDGVWDSSLGGIVNWDGCETGYSLVRQEDGSTAVRWDHKAAIASASSNTAKGIMGERKDESMSGFLDGVKSIFRLGQQNDGIRPEDLPPRFVVLLNAEKLSTLEALGPGQHEGTLLACIMRLAELTHCPIVPVLSSSTNWLLLRPQKGATEPAFMLELPSLTRKDVNQLLRSTFAPTSSSELPKDTLISLLSILLDLLQQTFEPYLGNEYEDYFWLTEKLWPQWIGYVEREEVESADVVRLVGAFKGTLSAEIDALSDLRPLMSNASENVDRPTSALEMAMLSRSPTRPSVANGDSAHHTPTKGKTSINQYGSPSGFYSPAVTPSKRGTTSGASSNTTNPLAQALPLLARYVLIAAFLASSNPARKDMLMLATQEDEMAAARRKKKGGGTRKTPVRKSGVKKDGTLRKEAVPQRLLGPKPFPVERLMAITETLLPVEQRSITSSPDILQEIATLTNLKLLVRTSASSSSVLAGSSISSASISAFDKLDGLKLKCNNLELETMEALGKTIGIKVSERLWEAQ